MSFAQYTFFINENFYNPDFRVLIGENVGLVDIEIQFSTSGIRKDFSVGITPFADKANFILSTKSNADFSILASSVANNPHLSLEVKEKMSFPDITIEFRENNSADYLIYSESDAISNTQILMALLPVIHQETQFKFKSLGDFLLARDVYIKNTTCDDIATFIKKHGNKKERLTEKKLQSSWLQEVQGYKVKSKYFVLASIKEMNEDEGAPSLKVFQVNTATWQKFLNNSNNSDYEERFRNLIYDSPCGCL